MNPLNLLKLFRAFTGGGVLNGKKSFGLNLVSIVSLAWALLSPATAPSEEALKSVLEHGQEAVHVVTVDLLPLVVAVVSQVLGLFSGLHSQSKIGTLLRTVGAFLGRHVDMDDIKEIDRQLKSGTGVVSPSKSQPIVATPIIIPKP